jgi:hypothetical protein
MPGVHKQLGSRRYVQDVAALGRCRTGIMLEADGLDTRDVAEALDLIDKLVSTLGKLKRQKEAAEAAGAHHAATSPTGTDDAD